MLIVCIVDLVELYVSVCLTGSIPLTAVSNLDVESKLTTHYQAPWPQ